MFSPDHISSPRARTPRFRLWAGLVATVGIVGLVLLAVELLVGSPQAAPRPDSSQSVMANAQSGTDRLDAAIARTQERLRQLPGDYVTWAALGSAYLEKSRITADPTLYAKAEEALTESLSVGPDENPAALTGLGAIANARHDFGKARELAQQALAINPFDADAFGVLADAETQLGNAEAATEAIQRMLDLRPALPALTRAAYDLEQHGRITEAQDLMNRALTAAFDPADIAFCRYQLGQLAWHSGDLDEAETQYAAAAAADPSYLPVRLGQAQLAAARGDLDEALATYAELTAASPTVDDLLAYAEVLRAAGRDDDAQAELSLAEAAHELFVASGGVDILEGAELALAQERPAEAVQLAKREWERRQFADVADTLAWALHLTGRDSEALAYAERAGSLGASNAKYAYHLGMIEASLGDSDAAKRHLAHAIDINPYFSPIDAPLAARTLAELEGS